MRVASPGIDEYDCVDVGRCPNRTLKEVLVACTCMQCGSDKTAATFFHTCLNGVRMGWTVVDPDQNTQTGRPNNSNCPDHLAEMTDDGSTAQFMDGCGASVAVKTLFCFNCGAVEVFEP